MLRTVVLGLSALSVFTLAPTALAHDDASHAAGAQEAEEAPRCVRLRNINGYSVLDREHVVLKGGVNHHYLVTTSHSCPGLNAGVRLATSFGQNARLCPPIVEYLTTRDGRCFIDTVESVESVEAARALVQAREAAEDEAESGAN